MQTEKIDFGRYGKAFQEGLVQLILEDRSFADQITEVLDSPAGKLILILQDKREVNEEISLEEELKKAILIERNKQLNQFSSIYFKKVEINTIINEK